MPNGDSTIRVFIRRKGENEKNRSNELYDKHMAQLLKVNKFVSVNIKAFLLD